MRAKISGRSLRFALLLFLVGGNLALAIFIPAAVRQNPGRARASRAGDGTPVVANFSLGNPTRVSGEAPKTAREERALPKL